MTEKEFQKTLIEYLDTLRPENSKFKGKVTCLDCDHEKCMFVGWCDVEPGGATILWNAFKFSEMLKEWKEKNEQTN